MELSSRKKTNMKLEFKNTEEELAYYEEVLETLPQYPTPLLNHAMGLVKFRISKLKEKLKDECEKENTKIY